jgi:hypothetical protein
MVDCYTLASTYSTASPEDFDEEKYSSFSPQALSSPLVQPNVLGYQNGSLIVSTARGMQAIPLCHPVLRIGTLMGANELDRAIKWFDAVPDRDHEALATFLERRGHPELAVQLPGISLETIIDLSMRHGYIDRLEEAVEEFGVKGLYAIDQGCGVSPSIFGPQPNSHSIVVCVAAYLLAHGRAELTRRIASELLRSGEDGKRDALLLASLLLNVDENDATRLMSRAVDGDSDASEWPIRKFVREHVL